VKRSADLIEHFGEIRKVHPQVPEQFIQDWKDYTYNWKTQVEYMSGEPLLSMNFLDDEDFEPMTFEEFARQKSETERSQPDPEYEEKFNPTQPNTMADLRSKI
jgi:hypothetical protein